LASFRHWSGFPQSTILQFTFFCVAFNSLREKIPRSLDLGNQERKKSHTASFPLIKLSSERRAGEVKILSSQTLSADSIVRSYTFSPIKTPLSLTIKVQRRRHRQPKQDIISGKFTSLWARPPPLLLTPHPTAQVQDEHPTIIDDLFFFSSKRLRSMVSTAKPLLWYLDIALLVPVPIPVAPSHDANYSHYLDIVHL
jgi:hypothetical protein